MYSDYLRYIIGNFPPSTVYHTLMFNFMFIIQVHSYEGKYFLRGYCFYLQSCMSEVGYIMRIAILGASGRTGQQLVRQALDAGHEVFALVRRPESFPIQHEKLTVLHGDAMNRQDVEKVVKKGEVVLSVLGYSKGSSRDVQSVATRYIITSMYQFGKRRLITLTNTYIPFQQDGNGLGQRFKRIMFQLFSGSTYRDTLDAAQAIKKSSLDWTIVRTARLTDGPHTGGYDVIVGSSHISRANAADFMLKHLEDKTYIHEAPVISE